MPSGLKSASDDDLAAEMAARQRARMEADHAAETEKRAAARAVLEPLQKITGGKALPAELEKLKEAAAGLPDNEFDLRNMIMQAGQLMERLAARIDRRIEDTSPPPALENNAP